MWRLALGTVLSLLPERWRNSLRLAEAIPWAKATIASGCAESLLALAALVYWYSLSVTTWAAEALDSALRAGPASDVPGPLIGLAGLVLWLLHPLTWLLAYFALEGLLRLLAAAFTEQVFGTLPLALVDWGHRKATRRGPGEAVPKPGGRAQLRSLISAVREKMIAGRLPQIEDEFTELSEGGEALFEIRSSRPKPEWIPPKTIRIGDSFFRLEHATRGKSPRPFVFRLKRLAAGVPGRTVIVYEGVRSLKNHTS